MSQYPNAFCVKCGQHTETLQKRTVVLDSQARAVRGKCVKCGSDVFKFLPKKKIVLKQQERASFKAKGNQGATVTSLHEAREKRRASDKLSAAHHSRVQEKDPIDYILLILGSVAAACVSYLIIR